jgi:hypothetical protein
MPLSSLQAWEEQKATLCAPASEALQIIGNKNEEGRLERIYEALQAIAWSQIRASHLQQII